MTSSSRSTRTRTGWQAALLALAVLGCAPVRAGLGQAEGSIAGERMRLSAQHAVARMPLYSVHELTLANGARLRQYANAGGQIFAVSWNSLAKPDLSTLLGDAFASYRSAAQGAARRGGIQRQFHHQEGDLVLQSSGHLQVYAGYAYRPSLLPPGLHIQALGLGQG